MSTTLLLLLVPPLSVDISCESTHTHYVLRETAHFFAGQMMETLSAFKRPMLAAAEEEPNENEDDLQQLSLPSLSPETYDYQQLTLMCGKRRRDSDAPVSFEAAFKMAVKCLNHIYAAAITRVTTDPSEY